MRNLILFANICCAKKNYTAAFKSFIFFISQVKINPQSGRIFAGAGSVNETYILLSNFCSTGAGKTGPKSVPVHQPHLFKESSNFLRQNYVQAYQS